MSALLAVAVVDLDARLLAIEEQDQRTRMLLCESPEILDRRYLDFDFPFLVRDVVVSLAYQELHIASSGIQAYGGPA